jgi:hypothetical protein
MSMCTVMTAASFVVWNPRTMRQDRSVRKSQ